MKKVLFVVPQLGTGGVEQLAKQWYTEAVKRDVEFIFAVNMLGGKTYDYFKEKGCTVLEMGILKEIGPIKYIQRYYRAIKSENVDIVHVPASCASALVLFAAWLAGCKVRIIHSHTNSYNVNEDRFINKAILKVVRLMNNGLSTLRMTGSVSAAEYCFGTSDSKKVIMLRNGIDIDKFTFSEETRKAKRNELGLDGSFVIGSVGRLCYQKNQKFIIEILRELLKIDANCQLIILGEGEDEAELRLIVKDGNLTDKIHFLGVTDNLSPYYQAMDAFVFPSRYEGLGIAAVEAQATGTLAYLSECVPSDAIISSTTKVLSLDEAPAKWAEAIWERRALRNDNATTDAISSGYDQNITNKRMISIYLGESGTDEN